MRGVPSGAARAARTTIVVHVLVLVIALGVRVVVDAAVEPEVDLALALAGRAVLAPALAHAAAHEPYGVLDELHRRAEDGRGERRVGGARRARSEVRRAVEVGVDARVGRVRVDALLVRPERVVGGESDELPDGAFC